MKTISMDGRTISYHRQGHGVPLVLVHGFPLDHTTWLPLVPHLERHFDLILPDLRGFGESSAGRGDIRMEEYAADLAALLDACELPKAVVAGHSMGGYVALAFARRTPQRLLGLGLVGSQVAADPPERQTARYETAALVREQGVKAVLGMAEKLSATQEHVTFFRSVIQRQNAEGVAAALAAMAERSDAAEVIKAIPVPLLLLHGDVDGLIPVERSREIKQLQPAAHLVELDGVGHSPPLEAPERTAQAFVDVFGN